MLCVTVPCFERIDYLDTPLIILHYVITFFLVREGGHHDESTNILNAIGMFISLLATCQQYYDNEKKMYL